MDDLINEFIQRARMAALNSARFGGQAEAFDLAADRLRGRDSGGGRTPTARSEDARPGAPVAELPGRTPASRHKPITKPATPPHPTRQTTTTPTYAVLRERGAEGIDRADLIAVLRSRGIEPRPRTLQRILAEGVRAGLLEKRGTNYSVLPLNQ